jgi:hypothetical protein
MADFRVCDAQVGQDGRASAPHDGIQIGALHCLPRPIVQGPQGAGTHKSHSFSIGRASALFALSMCSRMLSSCRQKQRSMSAVVKLQHH